MKIAILKADTVLPEFAARYGEYPDMVIALFRQIDPNLEFVVHDVEREHYPEHTDGVDAWLITGSKASVYEDQRWIHMLEAFVRRLHRERRVIIGICFGHQLVAQALGGKTAKASAGWGVGVHTANWYHKPQWLDLDADQFSLLVSHQDQVTIPAEGSIVLGGSQFCPNAVCQVGSNVLTLQGHPEFTSAYSRELMDFRRERLGEASYQQGIASLAKATHHRGIARSIIAFIARGGSDDFSASPPPSPALPDNA